MKKLKLLPLFTLLISCGISGSGKDDIEGLWSDVDSKHIAEITKIENNLYTLNVGGGEIGFGIKKGDTIYWTTVRKNNSVEKSFFDKNLYSI